MPEAVRDRLAVIGYWACSRELRDGLDGWDDLDELGKGTVENDLTLIGSALAR